MHALKNQYKERKEKTKSITLELQCGRLQNFDRESWIFPGKMEEAKLEGFWVAHTSMFCHCFANR